MVLLYHSTCPNFGTQSPLSIFRNLPTKKRQLLPQLPLRLKDKKRRIKLSCILNARLQLEFSEFYVHRQYLFLDDIRAEGKCIVRKNFIVPGVKTELLYPSLLFRYTRCDLLRRKVILNIEVCSFSAITPSVLFHIKLHRNREPIH